jgi:hypothetical protein
MTTAPRKLITSTFLILSCFAIGGADYNQFRRLVRCYAATRCNVMPPSI